MGRVAVQLQPLIVEHEPLDDELPPGATGLPVLFGSVLAVMQCHVCLRAGCHWLASALWVGPCGNAMPCMSPREPVANPEFIRKLETIPPAARESSAERRPPRPFVTHTTAHSTTASPTPICTDGDGPGSGEGTQWRPSPPFPSADSGRNPALPASNERPSGRVARGSSAVRATDFPIASFLAATALAIPRRKDRPEEHGQARATRQCHPPPSSRGDRCGDDEYRQSEPEKEGCRGAGEW